MENLSTFGAQYLESGGEGGIARGSTGVPSNPIICTWVNGGILCFESVRTYRELMP